MSDPPHSAPTTMARLSAPDQPHMTARLSVPDQPHSGLDPLSNGVPEGFSPLSSALGHERVRGGTTTSTENGDSGFDAIHSRLQRYSKLRQKAANHCFQFTAMMEDSLRRHPSGQYASPGPKSPVLPRRQVAAPRSPGASKWFTRSTSLQHQGTTITDVYYQDSPTRQQKRRPKKRAETWCNRQSSTPRISGVHHRTESSASAPDCGGVSCANCQCAGVRISEHLYSTLVHPKL